MLKISLNDPYLEGTTPTALQNDVAAYRKFYYDKENQVIINQLVNDFYTRFLFKIDAPTQEVGKPSGYCFNVIQQLEP